MPYNPSDGKPDTLNRDSVDALGLGRAVLYLDDPTTNVLRAITPADFTGTLAAVQIGQGSILGQSTGTIDATPRQLVSIPAGSGYARLQLHGAGVYARLDGTAASGAASDDQYAAGGMLELISATEIANFRYVTLSGTGSFSVLYRSY